MNCIAASIILRVMRSPFNVFQMESLTTCLMNKTFPLFFSFLCRELISTFWCYFRSWNSSNSISYFNSESIKYLFKRGYGTRFVRFKIPLSCVHLTSGILNFRRVYYMAIEKNSSESTILIKKFSSENFLI